MQIINTFFELFVTLQWLLTLCLPCFLFVCLCAVVFLPQPMIYFFPASFGLHVCLIVSRNETWWKGGVWPREEPNSFWC